MAALVFLVNTLLSLYLLAVLLRLILQWMRADFRNPLARALLQITNPVVVPLRRLLPAIGRIDTATVLLLLVLVLLRAAVPWLFSGIGLPSWSLWLQLAGVQLLQTVLWTYFLAILFYSLMSMLVPDTYNPAQSLLASMCEPLLRPVRKLIPPLGGIDFSPLWVCIAIQALLILIG
jgi:YggT family protein